MTNYLDQAISHMAQATSLLVDEEKFAKTDADRERARRLLYVLREAMKVANDE